jgi:hypothetical protein
MKREGLDQALPFFGRGPCWGCEGNPVARERPPGALHVSSLVASARFNRFTFRIAGHAARSIVSKMAAALMM